MSHNDWETGPGSCLFIKPDPLRFEFVIRSRFPITLLVVNFKLMEKGVMGYNNIMVEYDFYDDSSETLKTVKNVSR